MITELDNMPIEKRIELSKLLCSYTDMTTTVDVGAILGDFGISPEVLKAAIMEYNIVDSAFDKILKALKSYPATPKEEKCVIRKVGDEERIIAFLNDHSEEYTPVEIALSVGCDLAYVTRVVSANGLESFLKVVKQPKEKTSTAEKIRELIQTHPCKLTRKEVAEMVGCTIDPVNKAIRTYGLTELVAVRIEERKAKKKEKIIAYLKAHKGEYRKIEIARNVGCDLAYVTKVVTANGLESFLKEAGREAPLREKIIDFVNAHKGEYKKIEIARNVGCDPVYVARIVKENGLESLLRVTGRVSPLKKEIIDFIKAHPKKYTQKEIAVKHGCAISSLNKLIKESGLGAYVIDGRSQQKRKTKASSPKPPVVETPKQAPVTGGSFLKKSVYVRGIKELLQAGYSPERVTLGIKTLLEREKKPDSVRQESFAALILAFSVIVGAER